MPHLYNDEIRFQVEHTEIYSDEYDPYLPRPLWCLDCAYRWRLDIIIFYISNQPSATFALTDNVGRTLCHHIAMKGNAESLQILLTKGTNIEARDRFDYTPLLLAVKGKNEELVDALLNAGADATALSSAGISVLVEAIFSHSLSIAQSVTRSLEAINDDVFAPCTSSNVLHRAIQMGNEPITRLLLDLGADYSTADCYGTTALSAAAMSGHSNIVNLLLDRGADACPCDTFGRSALNSGAAELDFATVQHPVKATIQGDGDLSLPSGEEGWTPLHHFALCGNKACVELPLISGANVLATGLNGVTPSTCSLVRYEDNEIVQEEVCRVLIRAMGAAGADLSVPSEVPTGSGLTPLHLAANLGAEPIVRLLIENGANVLARDARQCLLVILALQSGHEAVCLLLVQEMIVCGHDFSSPLLSLLEVTESTDTFLDLAVSRQMDSLCCIAQRLSKIRFERR